MSNELQEHYFRKAKSCFFRWEEAGRVLVWDDGTTIAFREEIAAVMRRLAPDGLPPFHAIAVLLSACRNNWHQGRSILCDLAAEPHRSRLKQPLNGRAGADAVAVGLVLKRLDAVHQLPQDLRSDLVARCELAAMIFENQTRREGWLDASASRDLARQMEGGLPELLESEGGLQDALASPNAANDNALTLANQAHVLPDWAVYVRRDASDLLAAIRSLQAGIDGISSEDLRRRIKTGLEQQVLPVPEASPSDSESLIGQLMSDEELGGVAKLARNLMALLTFPRPLSQPDEVAMGGVSDITNRGQLDRLLLSELAHDDLTLASRIALNEALYLHRETPPSPRAQNRHVFLDTGLCMWGVPRLFATATGLSMAEMADEHLDVNVWRFDGCELNAATFSTREGIEQHLAQIDHFLTPAEAMRPLFSMPEEGECEFVIVTEQDVVKDDEFLKALSSALPDAPTYLISVDCHGSVVFSRFSERGIRVLRTGKLNLDDILTERTRKQDDLTVPSHLPILLAQTVFPLRTYQQPVAERSFRYSGGLVSFTGDGRLILWDETGRGARQLSDQLGKGRLFWYGLDPHGVPVLVWGFASESSLKIVRIHDDGYAAITNLTYEGVPKKVSGQLGNVFVEFTNRWDVFRSGRSKCVSSLAKEGRLKQIKSSLQAADLSATARFFKSYLHESHRPTAQWMALTVVSGEVKLEAVPLTRPGDVEHLFDRRGQGIVAVFKDGKIQKLYEDGPEIPSAGDLVAVSIDGASFMQEGANMCRHRLMHTDSLQAVNCWQSALDPFRPDTSEVLRTRTIRRKFRSICVANSQLVLRSAKGDRLSIDGENGISFRSYRDPVNSEEIRFESVPSPPGCVFKLEVATWKCGSRAVLDSRGMLHLQSCDTTVPEISLVLHEGRMAGWSAATGAFGDIYFQLSGTGTKPSEDSEVYDSTIREFIRCMSWN